MKKERGAIFVAVEKKDLTIKHTSGINVSSSATSIPKVCMAFCPEKQRTVMIGYDPMKPSIYVEEWGERFKNLNIREVSLIIDPTGEKIQIAQMKGKYVRPTEKNLMHYLRISPFNKDNHAKDSEFREEQPKVTASYYELNFEKQAKTRRTSDKEQTKAKALVYESDYEAKKAYCVAKGINTKAPDGAPLSDAELEDMLAYRAEKDPETFQKEYNTPEIWNAFYIRKAIERGYLSEKDGGRVLVDSTGNVVKSAPVSQRAIDALAKGAATNNANDAYSLDTIKGFVTGKKEKKVVERQSDKNVLDSAISCGVIEKQGDLYLFEGENLGSSRTAIINRLDTDEKLRTKVTKLVELESENG